jgi:L-ascorbate metabolism protein UlaG (beta-lactamase superfamily)
MDTRQIFHEGRGHMPGPALPVTVQLIGGPTVLIELGGLRLLTDPGFDEPGSYEVGGRRLTKNRGPARQPTDVGPVDAVLLSHDQHPDNLDRSGREFLGTVPLVLTTAAGAERLGGAAQPMAPYDVTTLPRPDGGELTVTALPAQHGPQGAEALSGPVIGFLLTAPGYERIYVSGDNASVDLVREIVERVGPVDIAVLFVGAARTRLFDGAPFTLTGELATEATKVLGARRVVPAHMDSWAHFTEGPAAITEAFTAAGLDSVLTMLEPGQSATL